MMLTIHTIGITHCMYRHAVPLLSEQERFVPDTKDQAIVLQGIKPIAHFMGKDAKDNAKLFVEVLERKRFFK